MKMCGKGLHDLDTPGVRGYRNTIGRGGKKRKSGYCKPCAVSSAVASKRRIRQALKDRVVERYGGRCACCGISRRIFLSLDHVGGGGSAEREVRTDEPYRIADREYRPDRYRVLCHNCNMASHHEENHTCIEEKQ